jgi:hypothetical protein
MQATPATWRALIAAGWAGRAGLKILCGGEALPRDLAHQLLDCCGTLWNVFSAKRSPQIETARKLPSAPPDFSPETVLRRFSG